ncbi:hypothetical protein PENTCL1PPCAC_9844, partial [Pristionchus entomophagus]
ARIEHDIESVIATRRRLFRTVRCKCLHLTRIDFSTFPINNVEKVIGECVFEALSITNRTRQLDQGVVEFIRRHQHEKVSLAMEDRLIDERTLLSLPPLSSLNAVWDPGFPGLW